MSIAKTRKPNQGIIPKQALRDIKKKFAKLEEEKKLVVWSKKLVDIEVEKVVGFAISRNLEVEAKNKTIDQKIYQESKLALPIVKVYSRQTYSYY